MPDIKLTKINYSVDGKKILSDINYTFKNNTITALIGPSGSGKSTLLKLLNGLHSPASGDIYYDDTSINDVDLIKLRKNAAMALQSAPMIHGTVYDNLNLPKSLFKEQLSQEKARQLLAEVELTDIDLNRNIKGLSGGQRQRLSIARTLVNTPEILLLDEITSSLDPSSTKEIEQLIIDLHNKRKTTVIMVTHNVQQVVRMSDSFVLLKNGSIAHTGVSDKLFQSDNASIQKFLRGEDE